MVSPWIHSPCAKLRAPNWEVGFSPAMMGCGEWAATHPCPWTTEGSDSISDASTAPERAGLALGEILILFSPREGGEVLTSESSRRSIERPGAGIKPLRER